MNTERDAAIKARALDGESFSAIGRAFGITGARVGQIVSGKRFRTVPARSDARPIRLNVGMQFAVVTGGWEVTKVTDDMVWFFKPEYDADKRYQRKYRRSQFEAQIRSNEIVITKASPR